MDTVSRADQQKTERVSTEDIRLAEQMLDLTRDRLLEALPYMNRALFSMQVTFCDAEVQESIPQDSTPRGNIPQGSTSRGSIPQGSIPRGNIPQENVRRETKTDLQNRPSGGGEEDSRPVLQKGVGTDGRLIYADAGTVIEMYVKNSVLLARLYMHMMFHCLFRHPFHYRHMDRPVWDFAADAAVEYAVLSLEAPGLKLDDDWETKRELDLLKKETGEPFTAERIYRYLEDLPASGSGAEKSSGSGAGKASGSGSGKPSGSGAEKPSGSMQESPEQPRLSGWCVPGTDLTFQEMALRMQRDRHEPWLFADADMPEEVIRRGGEEQGSRWRSISRGVQHDMEMHEKNQSLDPGSLSRVFSGAFEKKHSYADFLQRFARLMEDLHISSEEFDYIYYMYGLRLYGRMPLIEPLEYRETDRIRDFVIAIDTSGSCQGKIVESFLHRTWDVMKEAGIFTGKLNLHIIQADSKIQRDDVIRSQEDFDRYMQKVEIRGSGGTDFRPVFRHVDQLRRNGEFPHLQGLLYFTDGYGIFPQERPEYPVAFVFVKSRWEIPGIPGWAYRTVFDA